MAINVVEQFQAVNIQELFPSSLELQPVSVRDIYVDNVYKRTLALLTALSANGLTVLNSTTSGELKVAVTGAGYDTFEVKTGTAADAYNSTNTLTPGAVSSRWDILVETNDAVITVYNATNTGWQGDIILPVGYYSLDISSTSMRIKNRTAGNNATYQLVGWR